MWIKYLNDRKIRKFWEKEARNTAPQRVVKVSENVWQIVDATREVERILPYGVVYKDNDGTAGKRQE